MFLLHFNKSPVHGTERHAGRGATETPRTSVPNSAAPGMRDGGRGLGSSPHQVVTGSVVPLQLDVEVNGDFSWSSNGGAAAAAGRLGARCRTLIIYQLRVEVTEETWRVDGDVLRL